VSATAAGAPSPRTVLSLFLVLLLATLGAFALTRGLRAQADIVNAVEIEGQAGGGEFATIRFTLVDGDPSADVLVVDLAGVPVKSLLASEPLAAGPHEFVWDGRDEGGKPAEPGRYGLRVILGEQERDIRPAGRIRLAPGVR